MTKVEAQALAYAVETGAFAVNDVQRWADKEILRLAAPSEELIMLSTEKKHSSYNFALASNWC